MKMFLFKNTVNNTNIYPEQVLAGSQSTQQKQTLRHSTARRGEETEQDGTNIKIIATENMDEKV